MQEKIYRDKHPYFHHTLKANFSGKGNFSNIVYDICTDSNGFKKNCFDLKNNKYVEIWHKFCENKCKLFINIFKSLNLLKSKINKKEIIKRYYIDNDMHFNKMGNKFIFNELQILYDNNS